MTDRRGPSCQLAGSGLGQRHPGRYRRAGARQGLSPNSSPIRRCITPNIGTCSGRQRY